MVGDLALLLGCSFAIYDIFEWSTVWFAP